MLENAIIWRGVVEDRKDPLFMGRVRVRIFGLHTENKQEIPVEDLPWAVAVQPIFSAMNSGVGMTPTGPLEGTWVVGYFADGKNCQEPIVLGTLPGIQTRENDQKKGFNDPEGVYPKEDYLNQSDTNKMGRYENQDLISETIVKKKEELRLTNFKLANSTDLREEPVIPFTGYYPWNHAFQSESGHVFEVDDTPGAERLHKYHKSGTYEEVQANGSRVVKVVGDNYEIVARHNTVYIGGTSTTSIEGDTKIHIDAPFDIEVTGPAKAHFHDDVVVIYDKNVDETILGSKNTYIKGDWNIDIDGDYSTQVEGDIKSSCWKTHRIHAVSQASIDTGPNGDAQQNKFDENGLPSRIDFNSDQYSGKDVDDRSDKDYHEVPDITLEDLRPTNRIEVYSHEKDAPEDLDTTEAFEAFVEEGIRNEFFDKPTFEIVPEVESVLPATPPDDEPERDENDEVDLNKICNAFGKFDHINDFRGNLQLSPNFQLRDVTSHAAVSHYYLRSQLGLSKKQIVINLYWVCNKILEPILTAYPTMIVTSGFRHGSGRSQHFKGQAVDIQFTDITTNRDYYERALTLGLSIPYDQFLLEYKNTGTKLPWMHFSYNCENQRGEAMTFFNHRRITPVGILGLVKDDNVIASKTLKPRSQV